MKITKYIKGFGNFQPKNISTVILTLLLVFHSDSCSFAKTVYIVGIYKRTIIFMTYWCSSHYHSEMTVFVMLRRIYVKIQTF